MRFCGMIAATHLGKKTSHVQMDKPQQGRFSVPFPNYSCVQYCIVVSRVFDCFFSSDLLSVRIIEKGVFIINAISLGLLAYLPALLIVIGLFLLSR